MMSRPRAYSYVRMSTPEQLQGDSLRRQLAKTQRYADRHGLEIVERFDDIGVSAFRGRNVEFGALKRFRELIDSGEISRGSYLIVESMDRLSRDKVMKAFERLTEIINRGIIVVTLDDEQTYSEETLERNHYGIMIALGAMARAHEESKRKAGLLSDAWEEKRRAAREEGKLLTRRIPAWLTIDPSTEKIVPIESRARVINEIFTLVRDGWGAYSLSRHLNQRGEKPWSSRKNAVWRESYIKKIIASRTVLGEYQPHRIVQDSVRGKTRVQDGPPIAGYYPAVVSLQLFTEAQLAMRRRRISGRGRKGIRYSNLFTGLLRCSCGAGYRYIDKGSKPKGGQLLQCSVAYARGACSRKPLRYQLVETVLLQVIESLDLERALGGEARNKRVDAKRYELSMLQIEHRAIGEKIEHVMRVITSDSSVPPKSLKIKLDELEREQQSKASAIGAVDQEIGEMLDADPGKRQAIVARLVSEIRSDDGSALNEVARRAVVGELQRMIESIQILPNVRFAWEVVDDDANWKEAYSVETEAELDRLLREFCFELRIQYRNGDQHAVDSLQGVYLKVKGSRRMQELRLIKKSDRSASV